MEKFTHDHSILSDTVDDCENDLCSITINVNPAWNHHTDNELELLSAQDKLRRKAYRSLPLSFDRDFWEGSDISSEHDFVIVYTRHSQEILMSARTVSFTADSLLWRLSHEVDTKSVMNLLTAKNFFSNQESGLFLDRHMADKTSPVYAGNRVQVQRMFYRELARGRSSGGVVLMARQSDDERLMNKYKALGLDAIGLLQHLGSPHWLMTGNVRRSIISLQETFNIPEL